MTPLVIQHNHRSSRKRRSSASCPYASNHMIIMGKLFSLIICLSVAIIIVDANNPHSTIPRSNNRYTHYGLTTDVDNNNNGSNSNPTNPNSSSSNADLSTISAGSSLNKESYHPPWNPSSKINSDGFLSDYYPRSPGDWEVLANIRGKHGPRNQQRYVRLLNVPVKIRQGKHIAMHLIAFSCGQCIWFVNN